MKRSFGIPTDSHNDGLMGVAVHTSADEDMNRSLDWYAAGRCGEGFDIYMTVDGEKNIINYLMWS